MQSVFTNFASSRFVEHERVVEALRLCARRLKDACQDVRAVYLFGSFATGAATPRSDADIVIEMEDYDPGLQQKVHDTATTIFLEAPVAVDLFVMPSARLAAGGGVADALKREGIQLA